MECSDLGDRLEGLATGEAAGPEAARHLAACRGCSAALERARQIDAHLRARPTLRPSDQFTPRVLARVRLERWRAERVVDLGFNLVIGGGVLLAILGLVLLSNASGVAPVVRDASALFFEGVGLLVARAAAALPAFLGAVGLLGSALAAWWWADRRAAL
jgi:hypothetical protein